LKDSIPFYNSDLKGILKNLIGNWNFRRLINDALEQKQRYACGNSSFVKNENAENTLNYVETGKLTWDNTKEFNFDTVIPGLGYTRTFSECFEIDSNGNFCESVLITNYILSKINDNLDSIKSNS
jgi:hypothetical protein